MGGFREEERERQARFKRESPAFSEAARADGLYVKKKAIYTCCLPRECSKENLYPAIRDEAVDFFEAHRIQWHDKIGRNPSNPSNHLCDSQVSCVNFLFPLGSEPEAFAALLRPVYPGLRRMLPIEDGRHVSFEWIGARNYLKEPSSRVRGANTTSADAACLFETETGTRHLVLIEWKYTESYSHSPRAISRHGTDRIAIYSPHLAKPWCPLDMGRVPGFESLFVDPFDQFMRQQFLAAAMEDARELGSQRVTVLHIAPEANIAFRRVTSPKLAPFGDSATTVWRNLLRDPPTFQSMSTERLFAVLTADEFPQLAPWLAYIRTRYGWPPAPAHRLRGSTP